MAVCAAVLASGAAAETVLPATTSWIGNTYGYGDGTWVQIDIRAIAVTPAGKVYTNAPWDESGAEASVYQDGRMLGFAGGTHGWGNTGGSAVAVNGRYAYVAIAVGNEKGRLVGAGIWPAKGQQWYGISRRALGDLREAAPFRSAKAADPRARLAASFLTVNEVPVDTRAEVAGLAASDKLLYATDPAHDSVGVYDAETMERKTAWGAREPGRIALAGDGTLWLLTETLTGPARLAHMRADGQKIDDAPALPDGADAVDVAVDAKGRVLVADNGPRQQILIYAKSGDGYALSGTLGERGGIFSGTPGRPGPQRFNGLTGVGVDRAGNIYVATNGIGPRHDTIGAGLGAVLESYAPDGRLRWQVQGLLFVDGAWMDPARPNSVYTGNKRFDLDLSQPPGKEWKYAGFLSNRFKYPDDPVFHTDQWPGLPMARRLDGRTFLYLTDMYADHLKIYRFDPKRDGETAIPSGLLAGRARPVDKVPNRPPGGDWIWRDANGNGRFEDGEFDMNTTGRGMAGGWGWWVDTAGDIWRASEVRGINRFRFGGLDKAGNPVYSYAKLTQYPMPAPFTALRRALYEPATDTLYVTGYTADAPPVPGISKEVGRVLVRFDKWSTGAPVARYTAMLPWQPGAKPILTLASLTVEGRYLFAVEPVGTVHVYDKDNGKELGVIKPGPEVGRASGWVDVPFGISAYRRDNGEYLVFVEEDARGKVLMYRWRPA
ncbi:hypothetical protein [Burkholderia alba]|uniref:hypothetical protein n=1 Tax=Burkholderia alba TaxID=2683677 RepID=UPI002B051C5F|nr:hypothetical protein [Burkholderia alba]